MKFKRGKLPVFLASCTLTQTEPQYACARVPSAFECNQTQRAEATFEASRSLFHKAGSLPSHLIASFLKQVQARRGKPPPPPPPLANLLATLQPTKAIFSLITGLKNHRAVSRAAIYNKAGLPDNCVPCFASPQPKLTPAESKAQTILLQACCQGAADEELVVAKPDAVENSSRGWKEAFLKATGEAGRQHPLAAVAVEPRLLESFAILKAAYESIEMQLVDPDAKGIDGYPHENEGSAETPVVDGKNAA